MIAQEDGNQSNIVVYEDGYVISQFLNNHSIIYRFSSDQLGNNSPISMPLVCRRFDSTYSFLSHSLLVISIVVVDIGIVIMHIFRLNGGFSRLRLHFSSAYKIHRQSGKYRVSILMFSLSFFSLSVSLSLSVSISLSVSLFLSLCLSLSVSLSVSLSLCLSLSLAVSRCLSLSLSFLFSVLTSCF